MKYLHKTLLAFAAAMLLAPVISWAAEAAPPVMDVIAIDVSGASEPYPPLYDKITAVYKKHGSQGERSLWFNAWAGTNTGVAVVTIRYPNMAALAADNAVFDSTDYQATSQEFQQKGFRIASRSIVIQQR